MRIEAISTGDELLLGMVGDANTQNLAHQLWRLGLALSMATVVGDDEDSICRALKEGVRRARVVILSGGIGPTEDDRTLKAVARAAGRPMESVVIPPDLVSASVVDCQSPHQFVIPEGVRLLPNRIGSVPGSFLTIGSTMVFVLPGVPQEYGDMLAATVIPMILAASGDDEQAGLTRLHTAHEALRVFGLPERQVGTQLADLPRPPGTTLAFRVDYPETLVDMRVRAPSSAQASATVAELKRSVQGRLAPHAYGSQDESLASVAGQELRSLGLTLAVAESCTGGLVGELLTSVSGASAFFLGGVITYSNELKSRLLGVEEGVLMEHGAVSEACARAMTKGARLSTGANAALAVTGIAGPGGGSREKPVGTVHLVAEVGKKSIHSLHQFAGNRDQIRRQAALTVLWSLVTLLKKM